MEHNHPVNEIMETTIQKVKEMVDANTVVGTPIQSGEITLIPVSRISIGFATGGTEIPTKAARNDGKENFGGGGGAGVKVEPVAFVVIDGSSVKILPMALPAEGTADRIVELVPEVINKVSDMLEKRGKEKEEKSL